MTLLIEALIVAAVLAAAYFALTAAERRRREASRWRVGTRTGPDGSLRVVLEGPGGGERVVRELPPGLEGPELTAELRLAREEAALQAQELNRPLR